MLEAYSDLLTDIPGSTNATQHMITASYDKQIRVRWYSLPLHYKDAIKTELTQLLNIGIVEYSDSPHSAPIWPVLERDGILRLVYITES